MQLKSIKKEKGFTLIEILVVIGIIALLAAVVLIAINPARQFAQARDTQRASNINAILNAVGQNMADNKGLFVGCATIPAVATNMADDGYNIAPCIVPIYMSALPFDPSDTSAQYTDNTDYNTGYTIFQDSDTDRITISAPSTEIQETEISVTR